MKYIKNVNSNELKSKIEFKTKNNVLNSIDFKNIEDDENIKDKKIVYNASNAIKYIGQSGTCGYAVAAKGYIADYVLKSIPITWKPLHFDDSKNDLKYFVDLLAESTLYKKYTDYDTLIVHSTPDLWQKYIGEYNYIKTKIGYCTWETNKLPKNWVTDINRIPEVWVPSEFNKTCFINSGVNINIKVVPHIWHSKKLFNKKNVKIFDCFNNEIPSEKFTFYSIGEFNFRKGMEDLINVFNKLNDKHSETQLILKLHYKNYSEENKKYCIDLIKKYTDKLGKSIYLVIENLTNQEVLALHSFGDCYVSLNKGEGFGLTIFDAFNLGKNVITTGYGGQVDFLGLNYKGLVNFKINKVIGMEHFSTNYTSDQEWAYPDLDHTFFLMEKFYENQF